MRKALLLMLPTLLFSPAVNASPDVNPNDPIQGVAVTVSEGLDIIRATGCLPSYIHGDSIKTERAIARLLVEAEDCLEDEREDGKIYVLAWQVLDSMKKQFSWAYDTEDPQGTILEHAWDKPHFGNTSIKLHYLAFESDERALPAASIDAVISPWTAYREGLDYNPGHNTLLAAKSSFSLGEWFDVAAEPIFLASYPSKYKADLHSGNIKFTAKNFEFKAGRSPVYWGQGKEGRVIFSGNTKPIEMAQIGSPYPFKLPWILKHLGPFQYRVFLGLLDEDQYYSYSFLLGGRIMFKPRHNLEFGITRAMIFGGKGAPDFFFLEPIPELFGFRIKDGWVFNIPLKESAHDTSGYANNVMSADFRWRIPPLRNSELFLEIYCEDPLDFGDFFPEDSIFHGGLWVPRLNDQGQLQMLIEGTYSANIVYSHSIFRSGFTNGRRIMGTDLGTDSYEIKAWLARIATKKTKLWSSIAYQYHFISPIYGNLDPTMTTDEQRTIIKTGLTQLLTPNLRLILGGGLQYINHFNFQPGEKYSFLGELGIHHQF